MSFSSFSSFPGLPATSTSGGGTSAGREVAIAVVDRDDDKAKSKHRKKRRSPLDYPPSRNYGLGVRRSGDTRTRKSSSHSDDHRHTKSAIHAGVDVDVEWKQWEQLDVPNVESIHQEHEVTHSERQEMRRRLNAAVNENPSDVDAWLALISFQDHLISSRQTPRELENVCELKIAVVKKALAANPGHGLLSVVHFRLVLEAPGSGGGVESVMGMVDDALVVRPRDPFLQLFKVELVQTRLSSGVGYFSIRDMYAQLMASNRGSEGFLMHVYLRVAVLDYDAGYRERAIALLMFMLQLHIYVDPSLDFSRKLEQLEQHWNQGLGLFGILKGLDLPVLSEHFGIEDLFARWASCESDYDSSLFPLHPNQADDDTDPEAVIIFDDVLPFLFPVKQQRYLALITRYFLMFTGLVALPFEDCPAALMEDQLLHPSISEIEDVWRALSSFPLSLDSWFECKVVDRPPTLAICALSALNDVNSILEPVLLRVSAGTIASGRELARKFVYVDPTNAQRWKQCALLEMLHGERDKADQLCVQISRNARSWPRSVDLCGIIRVFIQIRIEGGMHSNLVAAICNFVVSASELPAPNQIVIVGSETITLAMQKLKSAVNDVLQILPYKDHFESILDVLMVHTWLTTLHVSFEAGLEVLRKYQSDVIHPSRYPPGSRFHQTFAMAQSQFIRTFTRSHNFNQSELARRSLETTALTFPMNTRLFEAVVEQNSYSEIKTLLDANFSSEHGLLYYEFLLFATKGKTSQYRVFEEALRSPQLANSPLLWSHYLRHSLVFAKDLSRAKSIYQRAINACMYSKQLYLEAFKPPLRAMFDDAELNQILEIMLVRDIRCNSIS